MIDIVLAEDHQVVRQGLKALLEGQPDIKVVGEASDGQQAIKLVLKLQPQVLILDWMLPGLSGLEVTRRLRAAGASTEIIVLSMHTDESYVRSALKEGAKGYVLKDSSASHLVAAIRACVNGERYLSPPISQLGLQMYSERIETGKLDPYQSLTDREREIFQLVAEGWTSKEIADKLAISPRTVETHRANFMEKLQLSSTADVTRFALRKGIISLIS